MAKQKKFGTFGGVFTPSILTILGVIMYLRLPWIAGQAGLFATLGIVFLAHLISVTTGLSVSSIATDKKVKAGGTYYMISRSLGLPIGGTLGLALFVGLSFSVSLYLIGFAESFLGYWELEITKNSIRLAGSIILVSVTIITFISTSLAIKTQYIIMTAIILSLISIVVGNHDYVPVEPLLTPIAGAAPFIILFGIFFPAVTGFEAGVSMSGDLQDPKKSIPSGTISAILIGLVVYILLAFFFSYSVSSDLLVNDPKALFKIAWIPELVVAGIWGATLSSAFGSILGAPRILQATAADNITHRFFSKGYGELNEPRNALLLTFIIAEIGILIGELDVIARIVSMFFITTYGFLNLSCAIESWASSDFRPDFKIPKIVSIIGSAACFIVMIQLDFVAMVGATVILGSLFIYLKRKELMLEGGDAWGSVWSSIVRTGLSKLSMQKTDARNWRPNILLFSGAASARPHLIEIAKAISGKLGIVSNFNLIEKQNAETLFKEETFTESADLKSDGIFTRSYVCRNFYQGIDVISRVYGFSGVEPNTVIMGWGRNTKDPAQFTELVSNFSELDLNSIYIDLDKERGFGNRKTIDIWWRGAGNNLAFILSIVRYLTSDSEWRDAKVRFLIISQNSSVIAKAYKNFSQILDQYRVHGEILIINNEIERKKPIEIMKAESASADLTIFGIPIVSESTAGKYIEMINNLTHELGTTMLVHASSAFNDIDIGIIKESVTETFETKVDRTEKLPELKAVTNAPLEKEVKHIHSKIISFYNNFYENALGEIKLSLIEAVSKSKTKAGNFFEYIGNRSRKLSESEKKKLALKVKASFIDYLMIEVDKVERRIKEHEETISENLDKLNSVLQESIIAAPDKLSIGYSKDDLKFEKGENLKDRFNKRILNFKFRKEATAISRSIDFEEYTRYYLNKIFSDHFVSFLDLFEKSVYKLISELHNIYNSFIFALDSIADKADEDENFFKVIDEETKLIEAAFKKAAAEFNAVIDRKYNELLTDLSADLQAMINDIENINAERLLKYKRKITGNDKIRMQSANNFSTVLPKNITSLLNTLRSDLIVFGVKTRIKEKSLGLKERIESGVDRSYLKDLIKLEVDVEEQIENAVKGDKALLQIEYEKEVSLKLEFLKFFEDCRNLLLEVPEHNQIIGEDFSEKIEQNLFAEESTTEIALRKLTEFYFESQFAGKLQDKVESLQSDLDTVHDEIEDMVNLTNFNLQNFESDLLSELPPEKQSISLLIDAQRKFTEERKKVENIVTEIKSSLDKFLSTSFEPLKSYRIIKSSKELGMNFRGLGSKKVVTSLTSTKDRFGIWFQNILVSLFYKRSEGILFAQKVTTEKKDSINASDFYKLAESLTPGEEVLAKIPYYYKKLFSGRASVSKEFWIGRDEELEECSKAVKFFRSGHSGALMIIGERNVGKSSISKHTAELNFNFNRIYNVSPPPCGSVNIEVFDKTVIKAIGISQYAEETFKSGAGESAVIFNDIDLWWERSSEGFSVLNRLFDLISAAGRNWFFILNMNINAFEFIRKIKAIDQNFLSVVKCGAFDAEELKEIILRRHRASGIDLVLNGIAEDRLSQLKLARYFNALFDYSRGNIGSALNGWINSIESVEGNTLFMRYPKQIDLSILKSIPEDWIVVIVQFILHRQLSCERLSEFFYDAPVFLSETVDKLKRAHIVRELDSNCLEINPYIEPYLVEFLGKRGLL